MGEKVCIDLKIQGSNNGKDIGVYAVTMEKPGTYPHDGTAATASFAYPHDEINFPASGVLTQEDILRQGGTHARTRARAHVPRPCVPSCIGFHWFRSFARESMRLDCVCSLSVCTRCRVYSSDAGGERFWQNRRDSGKQQTSH